MAFNATFNNISVISWRSVLLVGETGVPGENHRPAASHCQTLSHNVVSSTPRHEGIRTHNFRNIICYWILFSCNEQFVSLCHTHNCIKSTHSILSLTLSFSPLTMKDKLIFRNIMEAPHKTFFFYLWEETMNLWAKMKRQIII